jgi:hypothetical protein
MNPEPRTRNALDELELTPAELATVFRAHRIGSISYNGDSWFAADAGYDYDDAEATMQAAGVILARLARAALEATE